MQDKKNVFKVLGGNILGTRPSGRSAGSWKENVNKDLKEMLLDTINGVKLSNCAHRRFLLSVAFIAFLGS
jgi:hypothetical protein